MDKEQDIIYQKYLVDVNKCPRITAKREKELSDIINGNCSEEQKDKACNELVEANLKLVIKFALDFYNKFSFCRNISLMDLIAEGNISLIKSARKFNYQGAKFSTYACLSIQRDIKKYIFLSGLIHIPLSHFKYWCQIKDLEEKHKGLIDDETIAKKIGINTSTVEWIRTGQKCSKIKMIDEEENWHETFNDGTENTKDEIEGKDLRKFLIKKMQDVLSPRDKEILCDMFFNYSGCTLDFLGVKYKISRERIRQIYTVSLKKLRNGLKKEWKEKVEEYDKKFGVPLREDLEFERDAQQEKDNFCKVHADILKNKWLGFENWEEQQKKNDKQNKKAFKHYFGDGTA